MADIINMDEEYRSWIKSISLRYRQCQIKSAVSVNRELIAFYSREQRAKRTSLLVHLATAARVKYPAALLRSNLETSCSCPAACCGVFDWSLGQEVTEREAEKRYGSGFYDRLSRDLKTAFEGNRGFSGRNLRYMVRFYRLYSIPSSLPQVAAKSEESSGNSNLPQVVADLDFEDLFAVPWGHHRLIIDCCKDDYDKAAFFVKKTIQNNWSRAVLENFLDTDLYERQGEAVTNFAYSLPAPQSDLAQEMTKDPYNFDFLTIQEDYDEKQLKEALVDNVIKLLLEFGRGFAFVGKEYPLPIEGTEERIDLLFYHLWLHCYVVVEVKVRAFNSRDIGQTATYVAIADDLIRREGDNKTIGLIICKSKNNVLAKYAVGTSKEPIGISEYELSNLLPTPEEIETKLSEGTDGEER